MDDHYKNTIKTWKKLAERYEEKFMDFDLYNDTYTLFCSELSKSNGSILEVGSGPGNITRHLRAQLPDASILATDVSSEMIEAAKKNVENIQTEVLDAREIHTLNQQFDGIMCGFCVLYLDKPGLIKFVESSAALLNSEGIIYLSFVEGDYSDSYLQADSSGKSSDSMTVHYYQESDLLELFENNSIDHVQTIRLSYPLSDGSEQIHLILLGRKK